MDYKKPDFAERLKETYAQLRVKLLESWKQS
jgi:hypothetical protein